MTTIQQAIPWLDTFQRSRGLEGGVMVLGLGDGEVANALVDHTLVDDRFVLVDTWWRQGPGVGLEPTGPFSIGPERDFILIREDPKDVMGTEAMELERGNYRIVSVSAPGCMPLAEQLLCQGGLVIMPVNHDEDLSLAALYNVADRAETLFLTNDLTWRNDYRRVLSALPKEET